MFAARSAALSILALATSHAAILRHHYPLDGAASDAMGTADLTAMGNSVTFDPAGGAAEGFVRLGGSDDYLLASLDDGSALSVLGDYGTFRPFSVTFWVRQTAAQASANTHAVIGMTTNSTSSSTFNTGFEIITRESSGGRALRVRARNGGSGSNAGEINTGFDICNGSWRHVVAVYEADKRTVYVDGVLRGENTTPVSITTNPIRYFAVGAFIRAGSILDDLNADVDDVQIYEGPLTAAEAACLYQNPGETLNTIPPDGDLAAIDLIDPLIGAEDTGYCVPGACLPQSSIYPSPNTLAVAPSGYKAGSNVVGFAQLHAQGAGPSTPSYGNFLVSPRLGAGITETSHASPISNVTARPYSYRAKLNTWNTFCTVVPAANSAIYRFEFPSSADARICFDVARKLGRSDGMTSGSVTIDPATGTISGGGTFDGNWNPAPYQVFFYAKTDTLPLSGGTWIGSTASDGTLTATTATRQKLGGWMKFDTSTAHTVHLKLAVSFVSVEQARAHLEREIPTWDLTGLEAAAKTRWTDAISVLGAPGIGNAEGRKLYTALFHSLVQPRDRTLDSGWNAPFWDDQYTLWDTWQSLYPLLAIVKPDAVAANVNSFAERFARNGRAETAFIQGKDFQVGQGGDEVDPVIADALAKQIPGIDWEKVWPLLQFNTARRTSDYRNLGYVSYDGSIGGYDSRMKSGSSTLAFAYGDWCVSRVATSLGHAAEAAALLDRSRNWRNVWDASAGGDGFSGFVRGRYQNGSFRTTAATGGDGSDFYQGTCWNYSFNVPHERDAMIALMGGRARFIERLEFALGKNSNSYINFTNEPSFQAIWQFCHAGRPYLASYWADQLRQRFGDYSFPGDEDSGAMSSLYFFLTAGFFPCAGQDHYYLHGPRVPRLEFHVSGNKTFTITAENAGGANLYVQSAMLDGVPLETPLIRHADILSGSTLAFVMGPHPSAWGSATDFALPEKDELVLTPRQWRASLGTPEIAGHDTGSPEWGDGTNDADHSAIESVFPVVTLEQAGDSVTLSATAEFSGMESSVSPAQGFAWGLFNSNSNSNDTGWTGILAANDTSGARHVWRKPSGNSSPWHDPADLVALGAHGIATPAFTDGAYRFILTLTRNSTEGLDYFAALVRQSDGALLAAFSGTDTSPPTFAFNHAGLRAGDSLDADKIRISSCSVIARRTQYSGRNLHVPEGGLFLIRGQDFDLAQVTNLGVIEISNGSLALSGDLTNHGTLRLKGSGDLTVGGTLANTGVLDTILSTGSIIGVMENSGTWLDIHSVRVGLTFHGADLKLSFPGYAGHVYQIQRDASRALAGPWENLGDPVAGNGGDIQLMIPNGAVMPREFFRVSVLP